jgi:Mg2+ and Co2+ transporter CorA
LVDEFIPKCSQFSNQIKETDESIFGGTKEHLGEIEQLYSDFSFLHKYLRSKQNIVKTILRLNTHYTSNELKAYYRDVLDQVNILLHSLDNSKEMLHQIHSNLNARSQILLHHGRKKKFVLLNILQLIFLFYLPFSIICGTFSMNVPVPFKVSATNTDLTPFYVIVAVMFSTSSTLVIIALLWMLIRKHRLKRDNL